MILTGEKSVHTAEIVNSSARVPNISALSVRRARRDAPNRRANDNCDGSPDVTTGHDDETRRLRIRGILRTSELPPIGAALALTQRDHPLVNVERGILISHTRALLDRIVDVFVGHRQIVHEIAKLLLQAGWQGGAHGPW